MFFGSVRTSFSSPLLYGLTKCLHSKTLYYDVTPFLYYVMVWRFLVVLESCSLMLIFATRFIVPTGF